MFIYLRDGRILETKKDIKIVPVRKESDVKDSAFLITFYNLDGAADYAPIEDVVKISMFKSI